MRDQLLNLSGKYFNGFLEDTLSTLKDMQSAPIGQRPRSPQEMRALYDKIRQLSPEQVNLFFNTYVQHRGEKGMQEAKAFIQKYSKQPAAADLDPSTPDPPDAPTY